MLVYRKGFPSVFQTTQYLFVGNDFEVYVARIVYVLGRLAVYWQLRIQIIGLTIMLRSLMV